MSLMTDELNSQIRNDRETYGYNIDQLSFKSDFPMFDYLNGSIETGPNNTSRMNLGIDQGKSIMIVGKAGSGKSTFGIQLAYSVMKKYEESTMFLFDFEQSHTKARIQAITGMSNEYFDEHITINKVGIYTETVLKLVVKIAEFKKQHKDELMTENKEGLLDKDGKPVKILPPTFVFIDSIAAMRPQEMQEGDEMASLTAGARNAIANKGVFVKMLQPCMESNIIIICINHLNQNLNLGGITPPVAQTRFIKNTESVSGGVAILYLSNLWINIEAGNKLEEKDKYGIKGYEAKITIVKSRNAAAGKAANMIFNQYEGFDEDLSEFELLKANGLIKGAGVGMYLDGLDTEKFRMSNIKEKLKASPTFATRFKELVKETLDTSLKNASSDKITDSEFIDDSIAPVEPEILNESSDDQ